MNITMLKEEVLKVGYYAWYFSERSRNGELYGSAEDWRSMKCPWHSDGDPSLRVNILKGWWKCMAGCGQGDVFSFHAKVLGLDCKSEFPKVVESLALALGIDVTQFTATAPPSAPGTGSTAGTDAPKWTGFVDVATFLADDGDDGVPFLVEELIPHQAITIFGGNPKSYKSWLSIDLAVAVATGQQFLGRKLGGTFTRAGIVCKEDAKKEIQKRIWWMTRGRGIDPRDLSERIHVAAQSGFKLDDKKMAEELIAWVKKLKLDMVVLDPLRRLHVVNENDSTEMQKVFGVLTLLAKETTVILVAHNRKHGGEGSSPGHQLRGSGDLWALARSVLSVKRKDNVVTVEPEGNYVTSNDPIRLAFITEKNADGKETARFDRDQQPAGAASLDAQILQAIEEAGGLSTTQLRDRNLAGHGLLDKALADLYTAGRLRKETVITQDKKGRNRNQELWMVMKPDAKVVDIKLVKVEPVVVDAKPVNGSADANALTLYAPF